MKNLKPFIPAGKIECPKCLNGYMELKYCVEPDGTMLDGRKEYIEVTCGACGHVWNMETADSGKKE